VCAAIVEFVDYVRRTEPGTKLYAAWQRQDDPTRFVHLFEFADQAAHEAHGSSDAVRHFESVYGPVLVGGPVIFTDYGMVATNGGELA
jgi:quinol monooxygenase YgiN